MGSERDKSEQDDCDQHELTVPRSKLDLKELRQSVQARPRSPEAQRTLQLGSADKIQEMVDATRRAALRPALVVMTGDDVGKRISVMQGMVLGRDPTADVVLSDAGVSWQHARIEDRGDAWAIVDLGSTNGTSVRGEPCREALLKPGDDIAIGRCVLRFVLRDPLEQAHDEELRRLLEVDDLSGLYVRRAFDRELAQAIEAARASDTPVGLLVMDMDGLKQINDTHGHLFGAYTIGETGRVIGQVLGERGFAARFGGDEFCAALPGLDGSAAYQVATEIHAAVNSHAYQHEGVALRPGISIGVAAYPADADDPVRLFELADRALYRAKHAGKNRVER